jgi:hypothetical protein
MNLHTFKEEYRSKLIRIVDAKTRAQQKEIEEITSTEEQSDLKRTTKKMQFPWYQKFDKLLNVRVCALTSKGEILSGVHGDKSLKVTRRSGEHELFCYIPSKIRYLAVDVYIVVEISACNENGPPRYKLLTLDADGNVKAGRFLYVIDEELYFSQMSITKDGMIVIYGKRKQTMYICDSTNTRQEYKFRFPFKDTYPTKYNYSFTVSNKNEIIFTFRNSL